MFNELTLVLHIALLALMYGFLLLAVRVVSKDLSSAASPVAEAAATKDPRLVVLEGEDEKGTIYHIKDQIVIGRAPDCDIMLEDTFASSHHARIYTLDYEIWLEDLKSTNGTMIGNKKVEKIYILSSVNFDKSILDYMSDQLDTKTEFFDPFKNRRTIASEQSLSFSDRILISPALGFALSDNSRTPNAIFTHEEKNQESKAKRMNRFVFMSFLAALMVCVLTLFYQGAKLTSLKQHKTLLEKELTLQGPLLSEASMRQAVDNVKMQQKLAHQYSQKYLGLAVIGEIADLTPQAIRLISLQFRELNPSSPSGADKATQPNVNDLVMEGIIFAQKDVLETELTQYVMKLENSPVFSRVSVQQKNIVFYNKKDVMHFVLNAKLG